MTEEYTNEDDLGLSEETLARIKEKQEKEQQMLDNLKAPSTKDPFYKREELQTPRNMSQATMRRVLNAVEIAYKTRPNKSELPSVDFIKAHTSVSRQTIIRVLSSPEGKDALLKRGIAWTTNRNVYGNISPEQAFAISIVTDPTNRKPLNEKLKQAGITIGVWRNWMGNKVFKDAVNAVAETMIEDNIATLHTRLIQKADSGDIQAIKLAYEVTGRHDPAKQQTLDIARIISLVLEVITRHIPDPSILQKVSDDIEIIMSGGTPQAISELPANYVPSTVISEDEEDEPLEIATDLPELPDDFFNEVSNDKHDSAPGSYQAE